MVGDSADVVLVAVGQKKTANLVAALLQVCDIGENQIDAGLLFFRKADPAIDDDDVIARFEGKHILANLADSAEENKTNRLADDGHSFVVPDSGFRVLRSEFKVTLVICLRIRQARMAFHLLAPAFRPAVTGGG